MVEKSKPDRQSDIFHKSDRAAISSASTEENCEADKILPQEQRQDKKSTLPLEIVIASLFVILCAIGMAAIFHMSQWQFYLNILVLGIVVRRSWDFGNPKKVHPFDEIVGYALGGLIVLSALASQISGWRLFLYFGLVGCMTIGVTILRLAVRGDLSERITKN